MGIRTFFLVLFIITMLNRESFGDLDSKIQIQKQFEESERLLDNCLSSLGIPYNGVCDEKKIKTALTQYRKMKKARKAGLVEEEELSRMECRSFPYFASCKSQVCTCVIPSDCELKGEFYNNEGPLNCSGLYDEMVIQKKRFQLSKKEAAVVVSKSGKSGSSPNGSQFSIMVFFTGGFIVSFF